ncbi:uncharacterized protein LOC135680839 [Rhopilema esculentum]|uniref:uncharacterized protein LOC135680839 n=1 Tax=Rhopilema esculentum TaxID=499914 RepID=UPI0031E2AB21
MPNKNSQGDTKFREDAERTRFPALIRPTLGEGNQSARERYDVVAANIFGNVPEIRDLEIFKTQCLRYIKAEKVDELRGLISKWKTKVKDISMDFKDAGTGNTPAMIAAIRNNKEILKLLLEHSPDLTLQNVDEKTAVHLANQDLQSFMMSEKLKSDLIHAAWLGNVKAVRNMLRKDFDVNNTNKDGSTPLQLATRDINFFEKLPAMKEYEPWKVVKTLLEHNVDVNYIDFDGRSVMHYLVQNTGFAARGIANDLVTKIKRVDQKDSKELSPLHMASKLGDVKIVEALLNRGASVSCKSVDGKTPLHYAVLNSKMEVVELLISRNADPEECDFEGRSPLDIAKEKNNAKLIEVLQKTRDKNVNLTRPVKAPLRCMSLANMKKSNDDFTNLYAEEKDGEESSSQLTSSKKIPLDEIKNSKTIEERSPLSSKYPIKILPVEFHATPSNSSPRMSIRSASAKKARSLPDSFKLVDTTEYTRQLTDESEVSSKSGTLSSESTNAIRSNIQLPNLPLSKHVINNDLNPRKDAKTPENAPPYKKSKNKSKFSTDPISTANNTSSRSLIIAERKNSVRNHSAASSTRAFSPTRASLRSRKPSTASTRKSLDLGNCFGDFEKASEKITGVPTVLIELGSPTAPNPEETRQGKKALTIGSAASDRGRGLQNGYLDRTVLQGSANSSKRGSDENATSLVLEDKSGQKLANDLTSPQRSGIKENADRGEISGRPIVKNNVVPEVPSHLLPRSISKENKPGNTCLPKVADSKSVADVQNLDFVTNANENTPINGVKPQMKMNEENNVKKQVLHKENSRFIDAVASGRKRKPIVLSLFETNRMGGEIGNGYQLKVPEIGLKVQTNKGIYQLTKRKENGANVQRVKYRVPKQETQKGDAKKNKKRSQGSKSRKKVIGPKNREVKIEETNTNKIIENKNIMQSGTVLLTPKQSIDLNNNETSCNDLEALSEACIATESILEKASSDLDRMSISPDSAENHYFSDILETLAEEGPNSHAENSVDDIEEILPTDRILVEAGPTRERTNSYDFYKEITGIAFASGVNTVVSSGPSRRVSKDESLTRSSSISTQGSSEGSECDQEELQGWTRGDVIANNHKCIVYRGLSNRGKIIAVKQVELDRTQGTRDAEKQYRQLQDEIGMLRSLTHRYIVKFIGTTLEENLFNIFMEFIPGGSLDVVLRQFGPLPEKVFQRYTRQIISALAYLHSRDIVHRDIKGANIMLTSGGVVKLIDFGCAKHLNVDLTDPSQSANSLIGTPYWMAPEVIRGNGQNLKSDIWSLGCTVYELATGRPPWTGCRFAAMYAIASYDTEIPTLPDSFSEAARDFVARCLIRNLDDRPSAEELRHHAFIRFPGGYRMHP